MAKGINAVRGMHDILPDQSPDWQFLEDKIRTLLSAYGYQEIRMPLVEPTEVFKRSIGEVTDIVEKEMYTFDDRNGDSLSLRPEGTASCVRAALEHGLLHNQTQRLWYQGPMFRYERPQKGRYRQFHQVGIESFGFVGPDIDLEMVLMSARLWRVLGIEGLTLHVNSLGTADERAAYREQLLDFLRRNLDALDTDSKRRVETNPLRVLDSKDAGVQALLADAPLLRDHLGEESRAQFDYVILGLDAAGIDYQVNDRLVRGLDYYSRLVFEWITDDLGAQGTVCAGGRYDGLVEQMGGRSVPAVGMAMGLERLLALLDAQGRLTASADADIYLVAAAEVSATALALAETLRDAMPTRRIVTHCGGGGFKSQFKKADKSGARLALILGPDEIERGEVGIKPLRGGDQLTVARDDLVAALQEIFAN